MSSNFREVANFIWSMRNLIRDEYKRSKHGEIILPFTVLRRLDCVLAPTKESVLDAYNKYHKQIKDMTGILKKASGLSFYNTSKYDFVKLINEPSNIKENMIDYINGFSENVGDIIDRFKLRTKIKELDEKELLYDLVQSFSEVDLHPDKISNLEMGYVFEELIRKSNEDSNESAGEHFTPREIIRLMINLLMSKDKNDLSKKGKIVTVYDPACGSGGMLSISKEHIHDSINPDAHIELFGQEINDETYAICKSDMLIKGENADNIKFGSSFSKDGLTNSTFDYIVSNPPYGKDWKKDKTFIENEYERGSAGRFSAGLPRINDGQLLFLQHMISKMHKNGDRTRVAIVFNGSPLFTGDAGSGESEIRRWIIENDWLEAIVCLPNQLFYNTGITTYIWILTNKKDKEREGKVTLIDASDMSVKMRKSLGDKRNEISDEQIKDITKWYFYNKDHGRVKEFDNTDFAYRKVTIDRPLRLNFSANDERIERLKEETAFINLAKSGKKKDKEAKLKEEKEGKELQKKILDVLKSMDDKLYKSSVEFEKVLNSSLEKEGLKIKAPVKKAILSALSERDESADIVYDSKERPMHDSELRDTENIPYKEDIYEYFEREVKPHVPDAWINETIRDEKDGEIGKVGYEINFNKYYYKYIPPRDLEEIDKDLKETQKEILELLSEVTKEE